MMIWLEFLKRLRRSKTTPATNVTATSATLWASVTNKPNDYGEYWWEYSSDNGANWTSTAHQPYGTPNANCTSNSGADFRPSTSPRRQRAKPLDPLHLSLRRDPLRATGPTGSTRPAQAGRITAPSPPSPRSCVRTTPPTPTPRAYGVLMLGLMTVTAISTASRRLEAGLMTVDRLRQPWFADGGKSDSQSVDTERAELGYNSWRGYGDLPPNPDPLQRAPNLRTFWLFTEGGGHVPDWWVRLPKRLSGPLPDQTPTNRAEKRLHQTRKNLSLGACGRGPPKPNPAFPTRGAYETGYPDCAPAPPLGTWFHLQLTAHYTQSERDGGSPSV